MGWLKTTIFSWVGLMCLALYATDKWVTGTLLITGITAIAILDHINRGYWKKIGIATADGGVPIFGHLFGLMDTTQLIYHSQDKIYQKYKESKYVGSYFMWSPNLMVTDPEIVKNMAIKDFDHFVDRRQFTLPEKDKWGQDMLNIAEGAHWKGVRSVLSPTFSSGKIKNMFPLVNAKADALMVKLHKVTGNVESTVDMKNLFGRLTVDLIGTCAFGFESNCIEDETAEFEKKLAKAANQGIEVIFQILLYAVVPKVVAYFDWTLMSRWRYFKEMLEHTIKERKNSSFKRGDFVDLVLEAQATSEEPGSTKQITEDTVIASSVLFLIAGYDTVLSTLVIAAHVLAQHPEEQEKLRDELRDIVEENGSLNYQSIMEAKYLEAVIFETQRMYPVAPILERRCTKEYILPGTNTKIEKDRIVQFPVWSLQNDERYWKEPSKFNPDRFLPENKADIVPGTYMPFGLGPRNCIAMRFALMEVKLGIARLVQEFQLSLAPGREELGLKKGPMMRVEDTMPLVLTPVPEE